jgi:hypothetical protein
MAQLDGRPDHAATVLVTEGISPKTIAAGVVAFLAPLLLTAADALLAHLIGNPSLFAALPTVVQVPLLAFLGGLSAAVAAYRARPGAVTAKRSL